MKQAEFPKDFADRIANMVYVGAACFLFDIPLDIAYGALLDQFSGKEKPAKMNYNVIELAYQLVESQHDQERPVSLRAAQPD